MVMNETLKTDESVQKLRVSKHAIQVWVPHPYLFPTKAIRWKGGYDYPKTRYKSKLTPIYSYSTTGLLLFSFRPNILVYGRCVLYTLLENH